MVSSETRRERLPRYKRANTPPAMQITDRDVAILDAVCDMRFLTAEQIELLLFSPSTASSCRRRLSLLYHNAYLDRMLIPMKNAFGSTRAVYTLSRRGAEFVARARVCSTRDLDWQPGDTDKELYFLQHTLAINDFRIMVTNTAKARGLSLDWTDERTLRRRTMKDYVTDPKRPGQKLAVVPDGYFSLTDGGHDQAFALELDRGTVEEKRFKAKVRALGEWKMNGTYERRYGRKSLRVLFVVSGATRDPNRLQRIKRWTEAEAGRSLFWFANLGDLTPANLLSDELWHVAGREHPYALLGPSSRLSPSAS
jgi:Replication-relaxation